MRRHKKFLVFINQHRKHIALICGLFVLVLAVSFFLAKHWSISVSLRKPDVAHVDTRVGVHQSDLHVLAEASVHTCAPAPYKPTCYEEQIPKTMDTVTMEQAFQVTRVVQDMDASYTYCHVLGHKLAARETAKDPSDWKTVITRCPSGVCSNGCIHGAFQERFRAESLTDAEIETYLPEFSDVCEPRVGWQPTGLEQGTCYHALGHLLMYITEAHIHKAIPLCERIARNSKTGRDWSGLCFDGAFMQIFQPLETEDFALVKGKVPTRAGMAEFCAPFTGVQREPCWAESWPLQRDEILQPSGLTAFCQSPVLAVSDRDRCYNGMFYVVMAQFQLSTEKMRSFCNGLPAVRMGQCFANGASRMIETDYRNIGPAVELCNSATSESARATCYDEMVTYASYDFKPGSPEVKQLCAALPPEWSSRCGR